MISTKVRAKKLFTVVLNLGVMIALLLSVAPLSALAQSNAPDLFADVANAAAYDAPPDPDFVSRSRLVRINLDLIASAGSPADGIVGSDVTLNLFPDVSYTMKIASTEENNFGYSWIGDIAEQDQGYSFLVLADGAFIAHVGSTDGIYEVSQLSGDVYQVIQIDQSKMIDEPPGVYDVSAADLPDEEDDADFDAAADSAGRIDVMVVYTSAALAGEGSLAALKARIALAMTETNQGYANAGVSTRLRLVHIMETSYAGSGDIFTDVTRLKGKSDGFMDNVHGIRKTFAADMVGLVVENGGGYCGVAKKIMATAKTAFQVTRRSGCLTGYYSFGHEFGHLQGARHDTYVDPTNTPYSYGHGYVHTGGTAYNRWRTVMAYNSECSALGYDCTRVLYWSNPNKSYHSANTGTSITKNFKVLNNTDDTVANFSKKTIASDFNSSFNSNKKGWSAVKGKWTLKSGKYKSAGVKNKFASAKHSGKFGDLTYQVRMKRTGCSSCANHIIIRGNPNKLNSIYAWRPSYAFQYNNDGSFSVYEVKSNGTAVALHPWTVHPSINKNGWNTLKVVAVGSTLKFYINGTLVSTRTDSSLDVGKVGFAFYRYSAKGKLLVNWAKLSTTATADLDVNESVVPGIELKGGTMNQSP